MRPVRRHQRDLAGLRRIVKLKLHLVLRQTAAPSRSASAPAPACACADTAPESPPETPPPPLFLPGSTRHHAVHQLLAHARAHPLVVHAAVQVVRCRQVQPPQVLRLPRRQRIRMHRRNVRIGKQRQHPQRLGGLHLARKRAHRLQIEDVPPQRRRHLQMIANQPQQQLALIHIQFQPPGHALRHARALPRMVAGAAALAGIVQQRCQVQQRAVLHIAQNPPKRPAHSPIGPVCGSLQPMQRVDQHHGVLVHRVAVVRVADHQRVNPVKLRDQQLQNSQRMHRAQRVSGIGPQQNLLQMPPQRRPFLQMRRKQRQRLRHPLLARPVERASRPATSPQTAAAPPPGPAPDRPQLPVSLRPERPARFPPGSPIAGGSGRRRTFARAALPTTVQRPRRCLAGTTSSMWVRRPLHDPRMAEVEPHPVRRICRATAPRVVRSRSARSAAFAAASCACQSSVLSSRSCR